MLNRKNSTPLKSITTSVLNKKDTFHLAPVYEYDLNDENLESVLKKYRKQLEGRKVDLAEKEGAKKLYACLRRGTENIGIIL